MSSPGDPGIQAWRQARTFEELTDLTARWMEGSLPHHPLAGAEVARETEPLRETLAAFNRLGFLTTYSQPAVPLADGCGQRAAVEGYVREAHARALAALGLQTDLVVFVFPPGAGGGYRVPITVEAYHPCTWCGVCAGSELEALDSLTDEARRTLSRAWRTAILDPRWGRANYLWERVEAVLRGDAPPSPPFRSTPLPGLGLDTDFVF